MADWFNMFQQPKLKKINKKTVKKSCLQLPIFFISAFWNRILKTQVLTELFLALVLLWEAAIHTRTHTYVQFRVANWPHMRVFGLWEEAGPLGEKLAIFVSLCIFKSQTFICNIIYCNALHVDKHWFLVFFLIWFLTCLTLACGRGDAIAAAQTKQSVPWPSTPGQVCLCTAVLKHWPCGLFGLCYSCSCTDTYIVFKTTMAWHDWEPVMSCHVTD